MKMIAQVKLQLTPEQAAALRQTLERANAAANFLSDLAWRLQQFNQYNLHHAGYYSIREQFDLSAQIAVRLIAKVADAYKLDKQTKRTFKLLGAIAYDRRILTWHLDQQTVSLWALGGRIKVSFLAGERQLEMLKTYQGEADLVLRDGEFYLCQTCEIDEQKMAPVDDLLGVDLGIVNLATTSDGQNFTGADVEQTRLGYEQRRQALQKVGTQSARRRLRKMSKHQRRFQKQTNHTISKRIVETAKGTGRGIALENLKGIRGQTRLHRRQRSRQCNWSFGQLRTYIEYKAKLLGVPVIHVDPRDTSKTCSVCGHCVKANRPTRDEFKCLRCGHAAPADVNAAVNIAARAAVNRPMVPDTPILLV